MNEDPSGSEVRLIKQRQRHLGDYDIYGQWCEDRFGERFWLLRVISAHRNYSLQVSCGEFRDAKESVNLSGKPTVSLGEVATNLDPSAKEAVQDSIREWEGPG